jgi:hypothetical protein
MCDPDTFVFEFRSEELRYIDVRVRISQLVKRLNYLLSIFVSLMLGIGIRIDNHGADDIKY